MRFSSFNRKAGVQHTRRGVVAVGAAAVLAAAVAGCSADEITRVDDPDRLPPSALNDPNFLPVILAGAVRDFTVAYVGNGGGSADLLDGEGQVLQSGLLSDEFYASGTFPTRIEVDRRSTTDDNPNNQDVFRLLSRARRAAEQAADAFVRLDTAQSRVGRAQALNLAGFAYVLFGENYCSGVPVSEFSEATDEFTYGTPLPTDSLFLRALSRFDAALAAATAEEDEQMANLARVGRGRALLNLNRPADAAAAVAAVPTGFTYVVESSANTTDQNNGIWDFSANQGRWSVANNQGGNGLPYRDAFDLGDTRVPYYLAPVGDATRVGFARAVLRYQITKYPQRQTPTVVANGVEARLIEAEAALRTGDVGTFLARHNALRADPSLYTCPAQALGCVDRTAPLPALTDPGAAARVDTHFRERAFWLYATSHRLGDMRRLLRQYGRNAETVYPTGTYNRPAAAGGVIETGAGRGTFGTDVSLPVPFDERNNSNFQSCDNTQAGEVRQ